MIRAIKQDQSSVCQRFGSGSVINNLTQACNGSVFATVFTNHRFLTRFPVITVLTWTCVCLTFHFKSDVCRSGGHLFDISHLFDICPFVRHLLSGWVNSYWHCLPFPSPFFLVPATQQSHQSNQKPRNQQRTKQPAEHPAAAQEKPRSSNSRAARAANKRQRHTPYIFLLRPPGGPN